MSDEDATPAFRNVPLMYDGFDSDDIDDDDDIDDKVGLLDGRPAPSVLLTVGFFLFALVSGLSGGVFYAVGAFAADLKALEGYSQTGTNIVAAVTYAGSFFPFFFSPFIDDGSTRRRWFVLGRYFWLVFTCLLSAAGFLCAALCVVLRPAPLALTVLSFWMFGMGASLNFCVVIPIAELNLSASLFYKFNGVVQTCWALSGLAASLGYRFAPWSSAAKLTGVLSLACAGWLLAGLLAVVFLRRCPTTAARHQRSASFCQKLASGALLFKSPHFVCQFASLILAFGVAVNWYNNSEAVTLSLGGSQHLAESQVTVFFATATAGRLIASTLTSTQRLAQYRHSAFLFMAASYLTLLALHAGAAVKNTLFEMWFWNAADGVAYGFLWVLLPLISIRFQPADVAFETVYSFFSFGPGLGPLFFDYLSGRLYDNASVDGSPECYGRHCYHTYFIVAAVAALVAFALLVISHCTPKCGRQRRHTQQFNIEIMQLSSSLESNFYN